MEILVGLFGLGGMAAAALAVVVVLSMVAKRDQSRKKIYQPTGTPAAPVREKAPAAVIPQPQARDERNDRDGRDERNERDEQEVIAEAGLDLLSVLPPLPDEERAVDVRHVDEQRRRPRAPHPFDPTDSRPGGERRRQREGPPPPGRGTP